jgi:hypothetical protein
MYDSLKEPMKMIRLSFLHWRIHCSEQEMKRKGQKENRPKENRKNIQAKGDA